MTTATSPRLDARLRAAATRLDDPQRPIAETWRKVGRQAHALGLPGPGYDTIRLIVREHRRRRAEIHDLVAPVIADLAKGRVSAWDVERVIEAAKLARATPAASRLLQRSVTSAALDPGAGSRDRGELR